MIIPVSIKDHEFSSGLAHLDRNQNVVMTCIGVGRGAEGSLGPPGF